MFENLKNMGDLMKKAKDMRDQMKEVQKELKKEIVTEYGAGNEIEVVINGELEVQSIKIGESLLQSSTKEKLEKELLKTLNHAITKSKNAATKKLSAITGGLNIPGLT